MFIIIHTVKMLLNTINLKCHCSNSFTNFYKIYWKIMVIDIIITHADWLTDWMWACSLSLTAEEGVCGGRALCLQGCAHCLHRTERKRERERKREGERESGRDREKEGGRERESCRICPELLSLFLKGMTGALAPFSYLVMKIMN